MNLRITKKPGGNGSEESFTLVELLVVIAVLSMLGTTLLPALKIAREKASQGACTVNLKQIGLAFMAYAQDNDGYFPFAMSTDYKQYWYNCLARPPHYASNIRIFHCPSDISPPTNAVDLDGNGTYEAPIILSYGYIGGAATGFGPYTFRKRSKLLWPHETFMVADIASNASYALHSSTHPCKERFSDRHSGGCNILFFDGHVEWWPNDDIPDGTGHFWNGH